MSSFWSIWITVLTLGTLVGCFILLRWCLKNFAGVPEGESTGHDFDGIEELNNPLPKWWSTFFLVTIIWGFGYLLMYPGLGNFKGLFGWTSSNQGIVSMEDSKQQAAEAREKGLIVEYDMEMKAAEQRFGPIFDKFATFSIEEIASAKHQEVDFDVDQEITEAQEQLLQRKEAIEVGKRLFLQNCSQCHGSDARGTTGFPNLVDKDWLYGGTPADIKHSIMEGRKAQGMIAWETMLGGEQGVKDVAAYVLSLSGREAKQGNIESGKDKFVMCAACHGTEGQGSEAMGIALGAPRLNDNIWLYTSSERGIQESIRHGRAGVMPAWKDILGEKKVHVISAYVYSLSHE
ncbi:c-type cytochrome [Thalassotalea sp. 1_MG-2023]|uniref:cbb3-type cytochrome c oxidase N-terminal domain-containing protein n=1 Tax=Thalassotalea sp. 1_MG-2023 TaxID=3062680 RepID=UPI0026E232C8|nr:cbb3-type cytochrome c oxidase N-terminal domain-containing protein [Thalassotalea sp. 1_MG-2023]MDO6426894.1 c-type cytochrome [Thalassotalea sp. 1_MG-2023]